MIRIDDTHEMYQRRPLPAPRNRPPARDRLDRPGPLPPDPNGTPAQRAAFMQSRKLQPRGPIHNKFDPYLSIGEFALAAMYGQLKNRPQLSEPEQKLFEICRKAMIGKQPKI